MKAVRPRLWAIYCQDWQGSGGHSSQDAAVAVVQLGADPAALLPMELASWILVTCIRRDGAPAKRGGHERSRNYGWDDGGYIVAWEWNRRDHSILRRTR